MAFTSNNRAPAHFADRGADRDAGRDAGRGRIFGGGNGGAQTRGRRNDDDELEPADYWMNIGFNHVDEQTGEETFVSLGRGIPNTSIRRSTGGGPLAQAKNYLAEQMDEMAASLEEGETEIVTLQVQLRRVGSTSGKVSDDNPFLNSLRSIGFAAKPGAKEPA